MGLMDTVSNPYFGQMGMGLMAAAQPQPVGVNRYSLLMSAMQQAQQNQMQKRLFDMQVQDREEKRKERESRASALSELVGGYDPSTKINWDSGRVGMDPGQAQASAFRAFPEQMGAAMAGSMFPKPTAPSSLMKEADALYPRGSKEWKDYVTTRTLRPQNQTTVNVDAYPKPPAGWMYTQTPEGIGMEAIPGGPADLKNKAAEEQAAGRQKLTERYGDVVTNDIDRTLNLIKESNVTGLWSLAQSVPGTDAHNAAKLLDTIRANVGFERLQQMRASSPTGGALGQVSELENRLLQSTLGNLELSQSKEQLEYNLKRIRVIYEEIVNGASGIDAKQNPEAWMANINDRLENLDKPRRKYNPETGEFE